MVIEIKCPYCKSKHAYLSQKIPLKGTIRKIRIWYQCRGCFKKFHDETGKQLRRKWSQEMEEYLYSIMSEKLKPGCLKKAKGITSTTLYKALKDKFGENVIDKAGIQLRMNKFMAEHGVSTLPLSPSSNSQ